MCAWIKPVTLAKIFWAAHSVSMFTACSCVFTQEDCQTDKVSLLCFLAENFQNGSKDKLQLYSKISVLFWPYNHSRGLLMNVRPHSGNSGCSKFYKQIYKTNGLSRLSLSMDLQLCGDLPTPVWQHTGGRLLAMTDFWLGLLWQRRLWLTWNNFISFPQCCMKHPKVILK